jgi:hypothetical protein
VTPDEHRADPSRRTQPPDLTGEADYRRTGEGGQGLAGPGGSVFYQEPAGGWWGCGCQGVAALFGGGGASEA